MTSREPGYISARELKDERQTILNHNLIVDSLRRKKVFTTELQIDNTARDIPFLPTNGAFLILVQGVDNEMPTLISACTKVDVGVAGAIANLGSQNGTGATWNTAALTISSTATNFQIAHSLAQTGDFLITVVGWM